MKQLIISNVKLFKDKKFEWPDDATLLMLKGSNKLGKSTFEQVLRTILQVKNEMKDTTTRGEKSSTVVYKASDKDGNPMSVEWTHEDGKDKFKCSVIDGGKIKKITAVNSIRDVLGNHFRYSVQDIFNLVSTNEGKKKFMDEFVLALMTEKDKEDYLNAVIQSSSKQSKVTENNFYFKRRDLNRELELIAASLSDSVEWNADLQKELEECTLRADTESFRNKLYGVQKMISENIDTNTSIKDKRQELIDIVYALNTYDVDKSYLDLDKLNSSIKDRMTINKSLRAKLEIEENSLIRQIESAKDFATRLAELNSMKFTYDRMADKRKQFESLTDAVESYTKKIEDLKKVIADILARTKLPEGLEVVDDEVKLNGFSFDELSVSDSEARLARSLHQSTSRSSDAIPG